MAQETESKDTFSLQSILGLLKSQWKWFAISLAVCLGLGVYSIISTPKKYTRTAKILIRNDDSNSTGGFDLSGLEAFGKSSNIYNELAVIQSPDLMKQVVEDLQIYKKYWGEGKFHRNLLYGSTLPIRVDVDTLETKPFTFKIDILNDDECRLSDFTYNKEKVAGTSTGTFGAEIETPVGSVSIHKTLVYTQIDIKYPLVIYFSYTPIASAARSYAKQMSSNVQDQKSSIIDLSFTSESKQLADELLYSVIRNYNENWLNDRNQVATNTNVFLDARIKDIVDELDDVDTDIATFKSKNLIPDINGSSSRFLDQATAADKAILELNNQIYMAQYVRDYIAAIAPNQTMPVNSGFESQALSQQIANYNTRVIERNNLVAVSSDNNPVVVDMDNALANTRHAILASIENQLVTLKKELKSQEKYQGRAISQIESNPKQAKDLLAIERQQKVKESLYLYLLQKREENQLSKTYSAENARIIQAPNGDPNPTSPKPKMIIILAIFFGFGIPFGIFTIRDKLNTRVRSRADIAQLNIPFLGEIPYFLPKEERPSLMRRILIKLHLAKQPESSPANMVVKKGSRNLINEAFRIIRTNLNMIVGRESTGNIVAITSFNPSSGKSFISMNLGQTFAFRGKKVLVIDCDLRHGSTSKYVGNTSRGLVDYLVDSSKPFESLIVEYDHCPELHVLPVGAIPPNPTELLENGNLQKLLAEQRKNYDFIFIDCAPLDIVADTKIVEDLVDRSIVVVRVGMFEREDVPTLQTDYDEKRIRNMSLILNGVKETDLSHKGTHKNLYYYVSE